MIQDIMFWLRIINNNIRAKYTEVCQKSRVLWISQLLLLYLLLNLTTFGVPIKDLAAGGLHKKLGFH